VRGSQSTICLILAAIASGAVSFTAAASSSGAAGTLRVDGAAESFLHEMHADAGVYVRSVRMISEAPAGSAPGGIYSGLVRAGGRDPRVRADSPVPGVGQRNDIVLFASAFSSSQSDAWLRLILDHEFYHARHLARDGPAPLVDFGRGSANHDYYEAAAWAWVVERAAIGVYGVLTEPEIREARSTYKRHREGIRAFVLERQPTAWAHYGRFMPDMDAGFIAAERRAEKR